jgi:hypothetical protein
VHSFDTITSDCIDACLDCHKTCLGTAMTHCLEEGGEHARPQHFKLMIDCAAICTTAADFMLHKSRFHKQLCHLCAEICETCAADCERLGGMDDCAAACRKCAEACGAMG